MPVLDAHKEDIAFEKQIFLLVAAIGVGINGWLFTNWDIAKAYFIYVAGSAAAFDAVGLAILGHRIKNKIRELEAL